MKSFVFIVLCCFIVRCNSDPSTTDTSSAPASFIKKANPVESEVSNTTAPNSTAVNHQILKRIDELVDLVKSVQTEVRTLRGQLQSKMLMKPDDTIGNRALGTMSGSSSSHFNGGSTEQRFSNNNGILERYEAHTAFEQKPDGSCVKKVTENHNGRSEVREYPISCEEAKAEIDRSHQRTKNSIDIHTRNMRAHHQNIMKQHFAAAKQMEDNIKARFGGSFGF